jgi:hypothetical protein
MGRKLHGTWGSLVSPSARASARSVHRALLPEPFAPFGISEDDVPLTTCN